eukprot:COSAG02_NODE_513_length_20826_cov_323.015246_22_plen_62_part_00
MQLRSAPAATAEQPLPKLAQAAHETIFHVALLAAARKINRMKKHEEDEDDCQNCRRERHGH